MEAIIDPITSLPYRVICVSEHRIEIGSGNRETGLRVLCVLHSNYDTPAVAVSGFFSLPGFGAEYRARQVEIADGLDAQNKARAGA